MIYSINITDMARSVKQTQVIIYVTLISIAYNLAFLSLFILIFLEYPENIIFYTMVFLLFYILMAQPAKDYLITYFLFKMSFPGAKKTIIGPEKNQQLSSKRDVQNFLSDFIKENNLRHAYLIFEGSEQNCFFLKRDREMQKVNPDRYSNSNLLKYIKIRPDTRNMESFPIHIQQFLREQGWQTVVPVLFRSTVNGYIAFPVKLDKKMAQHLEKYVTRIGLIFENETMAEKALSTKLFQKEYTLAKRIERLLINISNESYGNYMAFSPLVGSEKKPFPVLVDKALSGKNDEKHYYLICRISEKTHRSAIILLFAVQGYFFIASRKPDSLTGLLKKLNHMLFENESESIDGVLIEYQNKAGWKAIPFGKNISIEYGGKVKHCHNDPLGTQIKSKYSVVNIKSPENITIKIKNYKVFEAERH